MGTLWPWKQMFPSPSTGGGWGWDSLALCLVGVPGLQVLAFDWVPFLLAPAGPAQGAFPAPGLGVSLKVVCWNFQENKAPLASLGRQDHLGPKVTCP